MQQRSLFLLIGLCFNTVISFGQTTVSVGKKSNYIKKIVDSYHYDKLVMDDAFSEAVVDRFLTNIDPSGMYFFQSDISGFKEVYGQSLDEEINNGTNAFFDAVAARFGERLAEGKARIEKYTDAHFDWNKAESFTILAGDAVTYATSEAEMNDRWRKWIKLGVLQELFSGAWHPDPNNTTIDSILNFEKEALEQEIKSERYAVKQFLEHPAGFKDYLATFYLDAIATTVDPHTTYFSANEQADFVGDLSRDNYAFGIELDEDAKGAVYIHGVTPGSAAWMSNELNKGDIVLSLKLGNAKTLDLSTAGMDEVSLLFANSKAETLIMRVRKANGQEKEVTLEKGIIYVDQDVIKSVILQGEKKVGYITLPDFYTDWGEEGTYGCANDVAKILVKLQKESIDGLILDLRNNGGGSLKEAIDLAGIFINYGPVGIVQGQTREPASIKDFNKGSIYDGPLVILVNGLSASASEIFSAAMQDYNRAIIVGSTTFGKSTGQIILPLDPNGQLDTGQGRGIKVDESLGYLKVTTSKYYHITQSTHQKEGLIPDVSFSDIYDIYDYRESSYANALVKDSVEKKVYYTPFADFPLGKLQAESANRWAISSYGKILEKSIDSLKTAYAADQKISLNIKTYQAENKQEDELIDYLFTLIEHESTAFDVINNQFDLKIMEMNAYRSELNEAYLSGLKKDIYIHEAY